MQEQYPEALDELMEFLRTLPGVGRRSAERMALAFYSWDEEKLAALGKNLAELKKRICKCRICGNMASGDNEEQLCGVCASPVRDRSILCVVEDSPQIRSIEASGVFRGVYHVLGGRIAPLEGKGVESIDLAGLERRLDEGEIKEVILALSPGVEGQATAIYIANALRERKIAVSSPARGLPAGSDLSYADPATIAAALSGRIVFEK